MVSPSYSSMTCLQMSMPYFLLNIYTEPDLLFCFDENLCSGESTLKIKFEKHKNIKNVYKNLRMRKKKKKQQSRVNSWSLPWSPPAVSAEFVGWLQWLQTAAFLPPPLRC